MIVASLIITLLLERLLFSSWIWEIRTYVVISLSILLPAVSVVLLFEYPTFLGAVVLALSVCRLYNLLRIAKARMHPAYLKLTTSRTSLVFSGLQLAVLPWLIGLIVVPHVSRWPLVIVSMQLVVAGGIFVVSIYTLYQTRYKQGTTFYADRDLPTVSLLIPARNETNDLEDCLRSALASDYPKLEIIVLDDCSQAKTSDIIKSFAHDGVRFVQGEPPEDRWLAKNQAYEKLYQEASGELLLFCGVDVRFSPHAIKALVTEMLSRNKQMVSVLPRRLSGSTAGAFIQPMRYWWELSLPRKLVNRPPVLSTTWLIRKHALERLGGFSAVSHNIIPEGYFARELVKNNEYSFIRANDTLDIQTRKSTASQRATAIRTRYPQLHRRPENVALMLVADLVFLVGPFVSLIYGCITHDMAVAVVGGIAALLLIVNHVTIVQITSPPNATVALLNFPIEVLTEVVILLVSMGRYEFGTVEWKDRNVCIPVMHVIPHLPKS